MPEARAAGDPLRDGVRGGDGGDDHAVRDADAGVEGDEASEGGERREAAEVDRGSG